MQDLSVKYMGLSLKNPVILGGSSLSGTLDGVKKAEDAGFGAVVLKSIFEEQIVSDAGSDMKGAQDYLGTSDAYNFLESASRNYYLDKYLKFTENARKAVNIPVIASINCTSDESWIDYAKAIAECKVDAIELNYYIIAGNSAVPGSEIEKKYISVTKAARKNISIPLALKIGWHFTSISNMVRNFSDIGINGIVMFNHFFRPDIDIDNVGVDLDKVLQPKGDYGETLRWTAMMSSEIKADICSSTGIRDAETMIKMLLAGARTVQLGSAVYMNGYNVAGTFTSFLSEWMEKHSYSSIKSFCGKLAQENMTSSDAQKWERNQFMRINS